MFASSPRCLLLVLLVLGLVFPSRASAAPWDLGSLLGKAGGFFSALWAPVGCEILPGSSQCVAAPASDRPTLGYPVWWSWMNGRYASGPAKAKSDGPVLGEVGCEILPGTNSCGS